MQKLVFRNGNGVEINLTDFTNYGITEWSGFSADGLNIQSQQVPFQDGSVFLDALMESRELSVTLAIQDENDMERRYRLRRELISVMNPKLGEGLLIYTNDYISKQIHVIPQIPDFGNKNSNDSGTPKAQLSWTACNPYWEDVEETEINFEGASYAEIVNNGDVECAVEITMCTESEENVTIKNDGSELKLTGVNGNILINTEVGKKKVVYENANTENLLFNPVYTTSLQKNRIAYKNDFLIWLNINDTTIVYFYNLRTKKLKAKKVYYTNLTLTSVSVVNNKVFLWGTGTSRSLIFELDCENDSYELIHEDAGWGYIQDICYYNDNYYALVFNRSLSSSGVAKSSNLTDWTYYAISGLNTIYDNYLTATSKGLFATSYNNIYKSTDGDSWESKYNYNSGYFCGVVEGEDDRLVCGGMIQVYSDDDGETWNTAINYSGSSNTNNRTFYNKLINTFIFTDTTRILFSSNGSIWYGQSSSIQIYQILWVSEYSLYALITNSGILLRRDISTIDDKKINDDYYFQSNIQSIFKIKKNELYLFFSNTNVLKSNSDNTFSVLDFNAYCGIEYEDKLILGVSGGVAIQQNGTIQNVSIMNCDYVTKIVYNDNVKRFYCIGKSTTPNWYGVWISDDLVNWQNIDMQDFVITDISTYLDKCFYCGNNGYLKYLKGNSTSPVGVNVTQSNLKAIAFDKSRNQFFVYGSGGVILEEVIGYITITFTASTYTDTSLITNGAFYSERYGRIVLCTNKGVKLFNDVYTLEDLSLTLNSYQGGLESNGELYLFSNANYNYLEVIKFVEGENIINKSDGNIGIKLAVGKNQFQVLSDKKTFVSVKYRQKYIGV